MNRREAYIKRTETVRKQKLALLFIFIIALMCSVLCFSNITKAKSPEVNSDSVKMYKSIVIYYGDTLETIASDNMTAEYGSITKYIKEVASINGITEDTVLVPGNHLVIPYYATENDNSYVEFLICN